MRIMKKLLAMSLIGCMALSMVACGSGETESNAVITTTENTDAKSVESTEMVSMDGLRNFKEIPYKSSLIGSYPGLWYDTSTQIVYIWNGNISGYSATTPSPYYSPNGHLYKYNPEANMLEEIEP